MTQQTWTASSSGSWTTASDWSGGVVPTSADDVFIEVPGITVTFNTGTLGAHSLTTSESVFAMTGGTLSIGESVSFGGAYAQSGGVFNVAGFGGQFNSTTTLSNGTLNSTGGLLNFEAGLDQSGGALVVSGEGASFEGNLVQTAGKLVVLSGDASAEGTNSLIAGTISGAGALAISLGTTTLGSTADLLISKILVSGGELAFASSAKAETLTFAHYFSATGGTVSVGQGNTLKLAGASQLQTQFDGGTIDALGYAALNNLTLNNSAALDIGAGAILTALGDGPGTITLNGGSQITIGAKASLTLTGNDTINNAGLGASMTNDGVLSRAGGAATAEIQASFTQSATGTTNIASGVLDFSGPTNNLAGTITGNGTLVLGAISGSTATDTFAPTVNISVATLDIESVGTTLNYAPTTTVVSNGMTTTSLSTTLSSYFDQSGGLFLLGATAERLTLTLASGAVLDGGEVKSSASTIVTQGLVSLGGQSDISQMYDIEGFTDFQVGAPVTSGTGTASGGTLLSTVYQTSVLELGVSASSGPTATISQGSAWYLEDAANISGTFGTFTNYGLLEKLNGAATSSIQSTLVNTSTGTIAVLDSRLTLAGSGTLSGSITGGGTLTAAGTTGTAGQLAFEGDGTYMLEAGLSLTVGQVLVSNSLFGPSPSVVELAAALNYAGIWSQDGGTLQLNGQELTLSGLATLDGGSILGTTSFGNASTPGTLISTGDLVLGGTNGVNLVISNAADVIIDKTAQMVTNVDVESGATLTVAAGAMLTQLDTGNVVNVGGAGTLDVAGTFFDNGTGTGSITANTVVTGGIGIDHGTLAFMGSVTGTGQLVLKAGTELDLNGVVGAAGANTVINMSAGNSVLFLTDAFAFNGVISGFTSGDFIELSQLEGGFITDKLDATGKILSVYSSNAPNQIFTIHFAQAQTIGNLVTGDGPHGYIGIFHR
jgi:hypothetical protein